jgi:hypothetical protein
VKFTFLTAFTGMDFAYIGEMNKRDYCRGHGYRFICRKSGFDKTRPPSWSKILFTKQYLPDCDWLFWSDADALVTNFSTKLESFVDPDHDFLITKDINGINAGHYFIKNTPWAYDFLDRVWDTDDVHHYWWEQASIIKMSEVDGYKERMKILPTKVFNAYPQPGHSWPDQNDCWQPGDFVVHFPGNSETSVSAWGKPKVRMMEEFYYKRV